MNLYYLQRNLIDRDWVFVGNADGLAYVGLQSTFEKDFERLFGRMSFLVDADEMILGDCVIQLEEYFAGERETFDFEVLECGTAFQQEVWRALREIPYGETATYSRIAERIGRPRAVRAVGSAIGRNPLLVLTPCHRVIGKDGTLTGFSAGLDLKRILLTVEKISFEER